MAILTLAILLDLFVGDPDWLWKRLPHPVVWFGKVIDFFDQNRRDWKLENLAEDFGARPGFMAGILLLLALIAICLAHSGLVAVIAGISPVAGVAVETLLVAVLIAQRGLYDHVKAVATALRANDLADGQAAVSMIVGRDVSPLNESGVCKAAIESLAENFSDGIVAPVLWYALLGLPGILIYKAVNTADSMIGHHNEKYEYFGKAAAVFDDWMNWPAARLASVLTVVATVIAQGEEAGRNVWKVTRRDAGGHHSPNAGWPESSFAASLGISLGGPRSYGDGKIDAVFLNNEGRNETRVADIDRALALFLRCCLCLLGGCALGWFFLG